MAVKILKMSQIERRIQVSRHFFCFVVVHSELFTYLPYHTTVAVSPYGTLHEHAMHNYCEKCKQRKQDRYVNKPNCEICVLKNPDEIHEKWMNPQRVIMR